MIKLLVKKEDFKNKLYSNSDDCPVYNAFIRELGDKSKKYNVSPGSINEVIDKGIPRILKKLFTFKEDSIVYKNCKAVESERIDIEIQLLEVKL